MSASSNKSSGGGGNFSSAVVFTDDLLFNGSSLEDQQEKQQLEDYPDNAFDFIFEGILLTVVTLFGIVANLIAIVVLLRNVEIVSCRERLK